MVEKGCDRVCGLYKQEESLWLLKKLWNKNGVCENEENASKQENGEGLWDFWNVF